jgi:hypothetical protein
MLDMSSVFHSSTPVLFRYSRPYLQMRNVSKDVIQNVETYVTIGAEPLLTHLVAEIEFSEVILLQLQKSLSVNSAV